MINDKLIHQWAADLKNATILQNMKKLPEKS